MKKSPRYTPVSRRRGRPDAIAWFLRNHPEITDGQIVKTLGTTKATIEQVRGKTHWNATNIKPVDPVTLGLIGQLELDALVKKAAEKRAKDDAKKGIVEEGPTLKPAGEPRKPRWPTTGPTRTEVCAFRGEVRWRGWPPNFTTEHTKSTKAPALS